MFHLSPQRTTWSVISFCVVAALVTIMLSWHVQQSPIAVTRQNPMPLGAAPILTTTPQQYWQVGVIAGSDARMTSAMRTRLRTRIPHVIAEQTTDYYWIGTYLADRSFIQIGYAVPWYDHVPRWFFCVFSPNGAKAQCPLGEPGSAGPTDAWHSYGLQAALDTHGQWSWVARFDGRVIGVIPEAVGTTGEAVPGIYAEQSAFAPHAATNDLGPVEFAPALEIAHGVGDTPLFAAPKSAYVTYSTNTSCSPYGIGMAGKNDILLGSGLVCLAAGSAIW